MRLSVWVVLPLFVPVAVCVAADAEFERLYELYWRQADAEQWREAEQTARNMRAVAESRLPQEVPYVLHNLASALEIQGRYQEA
jgi:hypothetical protein